MLRAPTGWGPRHHGPAAARNGNAALPAPLARNLFGMETRMHRPLILALAGLLLLSACATPAAPPASHAAIQPPALELTNYGIYTAPTNQSPAQPGAAGGPRLDSAKITFTQVTDQIPASLGVHFGVEFLLTGPALAYELKIITRFPRPMANPATGVFRTSAIVGARVNPGAPSMFGYTFDQVWEMLPGEWTIQVFSGETLLLEKKFTVTAP
jgi:hypothetical protein